MSSPEVICGVGGWTGPLPGDPDMNVVLSATPFSGGVRVSWTTPSTYPHAVAYTRVFRSRSNSFGSAVEQAQVSGSVYVDHIADEDVGGYYYWIQLVSVNGTQGAVIGPAFAISRSTVEDMLEAITGRIDSGKLAAALRADIDRIEVLSTGITEERNLRIQDNLAMAQTINAVHAIVDQNTALVHQEALARVTDTQAYAALVDTVQSTMGDNIAAVEVKMETDIQMIDGKLVEIGALYTAKVKVNGLIGGFGIYNDGTEVEAGFDVDSFWIGRSENDKVKPFVVTGGQVFMDDAMVRQLTFDKLVDSSGLGVFQNGRLRAQYINVDQLQIGANQVDGLGLLANQDVVLIGQVSGLGGLATQNDVSTQQVVGLGNLATQNNVTTNQVTGLGDLATQDTVNSGQVSGLAQAAVQALDNHTGGKVSNLSIWSTAGKLTAANASLFLDTGAIGSAFIGQAAIDTAHIKNLTVTALKLDNGAVVEDKLADWGVSTPKLQDEAATWADGAHISGTINLSAAGWTDIAQIGVNSAGESIIIMGSAEGTYRVVLGMDGDNQPIFQDSPISVRLVHNGVVLSTSQGTSISYIHKDRWGANVYTLQGYGGPAGAIQSFARNRSIVIWGSKK